MPVQFPGFDSPLQRRSVGSRRRHMKHKERNFLAAACSMVIIVILCTALAEPHWIYLKGGGCDKNSLGVFQFFHVGEFSSEGSQDSSVLIYNYGSHEMRNCVTSRILVIMRSIIALTFLGIISSVLSFSLDLFGPSSPSLKIIRRNALGNILTVIICVVINGFTYWVTDLLEQLQIETKPHKGSKVEVTFDVSFYLIATAGAMSVIATACNCLRRHPRDIEPHLLDDYDHDIWDLYGQGAPATQIPEQSCLPPPPAYTP
ncbi:transmembrane protein 127-like isoform X1 [Tubulanus polymorphus]|uniref:transmembrane protein 127-like isoform X1 n=1 Tax=Tubulanus polymorphus TaxID=672921 RepID=UPI003DA29004